MLESHGGPEVLTVRQVPDPVPGPDEVLIEVVSAGVNRGDILQRMGLYPGPPAAHEIPGLELAGRVRATGERVTRWHDGDAVMGIVGGGAYAELAAVHERQLLPVPENIPLTDAGGVPEVFLTAWDALVVQGGLTPGRTALVHAGASGVGTAAIQVAKAIGARVVVTASAAKLDACRAIGADQAIDYRSDDFGEVVTDVDVVLDVVGGDYVERNVRVLHTGGRIVQVGVMGSGSATVPIGLLMSKRASLVGTVLRPRPLEEKIALTQRFERELLPFLADGTCRPVIDARYPLADVAEAHRRIEANDTVGKLVLTL